MTGTGEDGGAGNGQGGDMSQRIQVGGAGGVTDPKALLPGRLKTRVVALAFGAQRIGALEREHPQVCVNLLSGVE